MYNGFRKYNSGNINIMLSGNIMENITFSGLLFMKFYNRVTYSGTPCIKIRRLKVPNAS